ncbi:ATP phosphoribosyltransferase [Marchantia polymorpha subsp. ruderalis]|uniref:ATP phosphoribosyltransferase n=2 Tax=Marchantia polymorpha TaxID=3197 RepID=A0AAF6B7T6_MARPO|nr:hypothetical protein MARPO_0157s0018 [Marchantia polymorpha]BBN08070.1 hypothetical protein Mp_4g08610 [Marchantia polymorpha subsp. ruderalis]|eukprot:PTQ28686.1 hypothetical protein MARPO_0157s0018 [Marchantia polymorpha]
MAMATTAAAPSLGCSRDVSFGTAMRGQAVPLELSKCRVGSQLRIACHSSTVRACASAGTTTLKQTRATPGEKQNVDRQTCRLALPSKGRMAEGTLSLLKDCSLPVRKLNPRQYIADIPGLKDLEVWFQRESDVVRKLRSGDVDMGIVGYDVVAEFGEDDPDLILIHDALQFGECHLGVAVPTYGIFESINTLSQLAAMPQWTSERPLRIVTGFTYLGSKFLREKGLHHVELSTADGALEAGPAMGTADAILDLVSSGTTLRENNLKELEGGKVISSQGVFVASKKALMNRPGVLESAHELLERFEAHLRARGQFSVVANMRGNSADEVAHNLLKMTSLHGLQGPTISPVYSNSTGEARVEYYAIVICVAKPDIFKAVRELRSAGGSGVLVSPLTYIFDEEPVRWRKLLDTLGR